MQAILEEIVNSEAVDHHEQLPGLAYNTTYYVWYEDPNLTGGAVTYNCSTNKGDVLNSPNNLFVGSITTPRAGAPDTTGNGDGGAGAQTGMVTIIGLTNDATLNTVTGNGSITNIGNMIDGDRTTFGSLTITGNGALNVARVFLNGAAGITQRFQTAKLFLDLEVPTNSLAGGTDTGVVAVGYRLTLASGSFNGILTLNPGSTQARTTFAVSLPPNANLSQVLLNLGIACSTSTSGNVEVRVYDAWIEAEG